MCALVNSSSGLGLPAFIEGSGATLISCDRRKTISGCGRCRDRHTSRRFWSC